MVLWSNEETQFNSTLSSESINSQFDKQALNLPSAICMPFLSDCFEQMYEWEFGPWLYITTLLTQVHTLKMSDSDYFQCNACGHYFTVFRIVFKIVGSLKCYTFMSPLYRGYFSFYYYCRCYLNYINTCLILVRVEL